MVALGVLTAVGWAVTRAVAVPGVAEDAGHWTSAPGLPAAGLGVALAVLGTAGLGERDAGAPRGERRSSRVRAALRAAAVGVALVPAPAIAFAALGPAPVHHHGTAPASVAAHPVHAAAVDPTAAAARFRPGFGGHAGRYVYANARRPHLPRWALTLALAAAAASVSLAGGTLRRRAPAPEMNAALQRRDSPARPLDRRPAVRHADA
jgi:hypothetical protein